MRRRNPPLPSSFASKKYFHGCSVESSAKKIMTEGLVPGNIVGSRAKGFLEPMAGKVYLTPSLGYAAIYALGAGMVGIDLSSDHGRELVNRGGSIGYIFVVNGSDLSDVEPDEDFVGEAIARGLNGNRGVSAADQEVARIASRFVHPSRLAKVRDGYVAFQASVGKQVMSKISPDLKIRLIEQGASIAHHGPIMPREAWALPKERFSEISNNGDGFFQIAQMVELR